MKRWNILYEDLPVEAYEVSGAQLHELLIPIRCVTDKFGMDPAHQIARLRELGIPTQILAVNNTRVRVISAADLCLWIATMTTRPTRQPKRFHAWRIRCVASLRTLAHQAVSKNATS